MNPRLKANSISTDSGVSQPPLPLIIRNGYLHVPANSRLLKPDHSTKLTPGQSAVFLDRDGVLVRDVHFLTSSNQLKLLPGAAEAICELQDLFLIIVVTNQSGIARGYITEEDLISIHGELVTLLGKKGAAVDALYYCPHLGTDCTCRKPKPGMLFQAREDFGIDLTKSFLIGDMPRDIQAGGAAGVTSILLTEISTTNAETSTIAQGMPEAAKLILDAALKTCTHSSEGD